MFNLCFFSSILCMVCPFYLESISFLLTKFCFSFFFNNKVIFVNIKNKKNSNNSFVDSGGQGGPIVKVQ